MNLKNDIIIGAKGFFMGAANVVPGVSGGTIALITNIFERIISALNSLMSASVWKSLKTDGVKAFWKAIDGEFLVSLLAGTAISIFSLAKVVTWCLAYHPIQTWALFFGLILASVFTMLKDVKGWKVSDILLTIVGAALGLAVCKLTPTQTPDGLWFIAICGAVAICTMILPGISGSFILVILGKYDLVMKAVGDLNLPILISFAIGCALGIMAFAKFLNWVLARWERQTMLVLIGFVIGTLVKVWPWADKAALESAQMLRTGVAGQPIEMQVCSAVIFMVLGAALIIAVEWLGHRKKK